MTPIYHYDPDQKFFLGQGWAGTDPLEPERDVVPAHATLIAPPSYGAGFIPVFDEETQTWSVVEDHVGETWYTATYGDPPVIITQVGPPPAGLQATPPAAPALDPLAPKPIAKVTAVRFTYAAGLITMADDQTGMSFVSRVSTGRYRCYFDDMQPDTCYYPIPGVNDLNVRNIRITARTTTYVEVRIVDGTGVAADAAEVFLQVNRVM